MPRSMGAFQAGAIHLYLNLVPANKVTLRYSENFAFINFESFSNMDLY
jgi:hypothetical protein